MSREPRTLDLGRLRLAALPPGIGGGTTQVASGIDAASGELLVFVRFGNLVVSLDPDAAVELGRAIQLEASIARIGEGRS